MRLTYEQATHAKNALENLLVNKELVIVSIPENNKGIHSIITNPVISEIKISELGETGYFTLYFECSHMSYSGTEISYMVVLEHMTIYRQTQVIMVNDVHYGTLLISPLHQTEYTLTKFNQSFNILTWMDIKGMENST